MTTSCANLNRVAEATLDDRAQMITLEKFEPNIGAPFKVLLIDSVQQKVDASGGVLETCIPNMAGLLKEVALARSLCNRKFAPADIKFVRKAVGLRANELAALLGISAEHLSRCENGDRALSIAAEKLLRVIVLKRRYDYSSIREKMMSYLDREELSQERQRELKEILLNYNSAVSDLEKAIFDSQIDAVHSAGEALCFNFSLISLEAETDNASHLQNDEEEWRRAA